MLAEMILQSLACAVMYDLIKRPLHDATPKPTKPPCHRSYRESIAANTPSAVGECIHRNSTKHRRSILPPNLLKIDGLSRDVEFRGFPASLPFDLGGKKGNIVTSSKIPTVLKSWRVVAVDGHRPASGDFSRAITLAQQRNRKFLITFLFGDSNDTYEDISSDLPIKDEQPKDFSESVSCDDDMKNEVNLEAKPADEHRLREVEILAEKSRMMAKEQQRKDAEEARLALAMKNVEEEAARVKKTQEDQERERIRATELAVIENQKAANQKELAVREDLKRVEVEVGLPARDTVEDTAAVLFAAMHKRSQPPAMIVSKPGGPCDKCDGPHDASRCPHFNGKSRDTHKDSMGMFKKKRNDEKDSEDVGCGVIVLLPSQVRVVGQPGDGSCLFHSLSHGLRHLHVSPGATAGTLRAELEDYICAHPDELISDTPISDWILWESKASVESYTSRMRKSCDWGGAIEIAVCARLKDVNVDVYEKQDGMYMCISHFEAPRTNGGRYQPAKTIAVLYGGRCHYDALVIR